MGTPTKPEFVLFISNCKFSNNFLNKLKTKEELIKKFNIVDINKIPVVPNEIEEVPCVYDGNNVFQGKDAFKWLNEKMSDYLSAANDGLMYSFLDGQDEQVFGNYSLLEQKNGSFGIESPNLSSGSSGPSGQSGQNSMNMLGTPNDPTRMAKINTSTDNKNRTLDSLLASRTNDLQSFGK